MNTEKLTWYVARSGGIVAWLLLACGLLLGLALSSKILGRRVSPAWTLAVHRYLGALSVIFTAVHVAAVMLDDFVDFGVVDVLVPGASEWNPAAVAWGIVGMYILVAIEVTSLFMRRLPKRLWRAIHWSSAVLFVTATVHGWKAGSDAGRAFIVAIVGAIVVLTALTVARVVSARRTARLGSRAGVRQQLGADGPLSPLALDASVDPDPLAEAQPSSASSADRQRKLASMPRIEEPPWRQNRRRRLALHALCPPDTHGSEVSEACPAAQPVPV